MQQIREILQQVVNAFESDSLTQKTTETARINLYHLVHHRCKQDHIQALELTTIVQKLKSYPNKHVSELTSVLLTKDEWQM